MSKTVISSTIAVQGIVSLFFIGAYIVNAVKFTNCDFEPDFKCEIIHGVGLIPSPISAITVWFDSDKTDK